MNRLGSLIRTCVFLAMLSAAGWAYWYHVTHQSPKDVPMSDAGRAPLLGLVDGSPATLRFTSTEALELLAVRVQDVSAAPPPRTVRLHGTLAIDPNRLVHVHSRFPGEVVTIGQRTDDGQHRPLRYGDRVARGDLVATLWSKEMGEKKSELVDAISRLRIDRSVLAKLEGVTAGIVSQRQIMETRRKVDEDLVDVARIERTLRSWRLSDEEIEGVKQETPARAQNDPEDSPNSRRWAETELRSPIDGMIVEKNYNVGDVVDAQDNLFKVADLSRVQVLVQAYEDDMESIRSLPPHDRRWRLQLQSDPDNQPIEGVFELFGSVIDPAQRTGTLMGWLENPSNSMLVGQFVTATIMLPAEEGAVAIPETALIEEGDSASVFVEVAPLTFRRQSVHVRRRMGGSVLATFSGGPDETPSPGGRGFRVVVGGAIGLAGELASLENQAAARETPPLAHP
jgi:cobalt-zinc-cadmium efflux system membrane fusion protein